MQKRVLLAGLPLLVAVLVFFGLWIANKLTTPPWKSELNQYIDFKASPPDLPITIQRTIQASQPWKFSAEMSAATFGDCFYFHSSTCYKPDDAKSTPPILFPPEGVSYAGDCFHFLPNTCEKPEEAISDPSLPFPPEELWCALLKTSNRGAATSWVVYIAEHQNLFNADWIVHESSKSINDPQLKQDLTIIGCGPLLDPGR
jgi:hypothetical protein